MRRRADRLGAELLGRALPGGFGEAWDAALFKAFAAELRPIDGVTDLLGRLALPRCVASNSSRERMRVALQAAGLLRAFEGRMFSAADVARPKPAPDVFGYAAGAHSSAEALAAGGAVVFRDMRALPALLRA